MVGHGVWLRCGSVAYWGNWRRGGDGAGVYVGIVTVLEDVEHGQLRKLTTQYSWIASEVMNHDL